MQQSFYQLRIKMVSRFDIYIHKLCKLKSFNMQQFFEMFQLQLAVSSFQILSPPVHVCYCKSVVFETFIIR